MEIGSSASYKSGNLTVGMAQQGQDQQSDRGTTAKAAEAAAMTSSIELIRKDKSQLSISDEAIVKAIEKANKAINGVGKRFEYSVHKKTGEILVKVINQDTNEVIREIPPEKLLDLVAKLQEICGVIIDERR